MRNLKHFSTAAGALLGCLAMAPTAALADHWHRGYEHGRFGYHEVRPAWSAPAYSYRPSVVVRAPRVELDLGWWRTGRWTHANYGGRLGWWWVAGSTWYPYAAPVYPYPAAAPVAVAQAPAQDVWYWCQSAQAYYPYVATCAEPWQPVQPQ